MMFREVKPREKLTVGQTVQNALGRRFVVSKVGLRWVWLNDFEGRPAGLSKVNDVFPVQDQKDEEAKSNRKTHDEIVLESLDEEFNF